MDNPIRECLEHEKNVAKADVTYACDDDARFWAEKRLAKMTELLGQCDKLLAYLSWVEQAYLRRTGKHGERQVHINRPEFLRSDGAARCTGRE